MVVEECIKLLSHVSFQIHRGDARRPRRDHPRQRARRRPQEAVQTPLQVRQRLPQPLPVLADQIGGLEGCVKCGWLSWPSFKFTSNGVRLRENQVGAPFSPFKNGFHFHLFL